MTEHSSDDPSKANAGTSTGDSSAAVAADTDEPTATQSHEPTATQSHEPTATQSHEATATGSRRSLLAAAAGVFVSTLAGITALGTASEPVAAIDGDPAALEAGDGPTVTSNDGRVESLHLSPVVDVSWRDFGAGVDAVTLTLAVGTDAGVDRVYEETLTSDGPKTPGDIESVETGDEADGSETPDFDAVDGEISVAFDRVDATERGDTVTSETLSAPDLAGGETETTTLDVVLRADVTGGEDEATVVRTTTVDVAIDNPAGEADAGGTVEVEAE